MNCLRRNGIINAINHNEVFSLAYPAIKVMHNNPELIGMAQVEPDIIYSHVLPEGLKLTLILPWRDKNKTEHPLRPLIVFVQGSGWTNPNVNKQIPQLSQYARAGFAVATITHRNAAEGHAFPAYLQDTKTAIRFLRAHAAEYAIDPDHVCIYGTSSGGNTALLVGLTGDDPRYKTEEYKAYSDRVQCVVECFGPTDLMQMLPEEYIDLMRCPAMDNTPFIEPFRGLVGENDVRQVLKDMSPVNYIDSCKKIPPTLIIHGDADEIVPYAQGTLMYKRLYDAKAIVRMICIKDAPHEGSFWSEELHQNIRTFIGEYIK